MHLTEEQAKLVQQSKGPVEVIDPTTNKAYVLLSSELYLKNRDLLQAEAPAEQPLAANPMKQHTSVPTQEESQPLRQRLLDLPVHPEVAEHLQERCTQLSIRGARPRQELLEELLLQWYYGGQSVGWLRTLHGKIIVAAGSLDEAFDGQLAVLSPQERRQLVIEAVYPWNDAINWLPTMGNDEG